MNTDKERARLARTVKMLIERIEQNQQLLQHFQQVEARLLTCSGLAELMQLFFDGMVEHFELTDIGLVLVDSDYSLRDLFDRLDVGNYKNRLQLRHTDDFCLSLYPQQKAVVLGELDTLTSSRLFPNAKQLGSVALLPLLSGEQLIGSMHLGSIAADRFTPDKSTDFLRHLALIMSVCLQNCVAREHLRLQGQVDILTQVRNRRSFDEEFAKEMERAERSDESVSVMFIDVDHFKKINDEHGHQAGDLCLKIVAEAINQQLRKTDILARYGGEEFVVLLPCCPLDSSRDIAERIRLVISQLQVASHTQVPIQPTVSIGLTCWQPLAERTVNLQRVGERLLNCADEAMYQAKRNGRNQVVVRPFYQLV